jgi:hypothetical protein
MLTTVLHIHMQFLSSRQLRALGHCEKKRIAGQEYPLSMHQQNVDHHTGHSRMIPSRSGLWDIVAIQNYGTSADFKSRIARQNVGWIVGLWSFGIAEKVNGMTKTSGTTTFNALAEPHSNANSSTTNSPQSRTLVETILALKILGRMGAMAKTILWGKDPRCIRSTSIDPPRYSPKHSRRSQIILRLWCSVGV